MTSSNDPRSGRKLLRSHVVPAFVDNERPSAFTDIGSAGMGGVGNGRALRSATDYGSIINGKGWWS
jgi:hypothetical protein